MTGEWVNRFDENGCGCYGIGDYSVLLAFNVLHTYKVSTWWMLKFVM
jgi:hypothetical protein